jgi:hypothetical protein
LEVFSSVSTTAPARFGNASCNVDIGAIADTGYGVAVNARSWGLSLQTADLTRMFIANNGSVGIGLASPDARLSSAHFVVVGSGNQARCYYGATNKCLLFYRTDTAAQLQSQTDSVGYDPLLLNPIAGNVMIGGAGALPQTLLHCSAAATVAITSECTLTSGFAQLRLKTDNRAFQIATGGTGSGWGGQFYVYDEMAGAARFIITAPGFIKTSLSAYDSATAGDLGVTRTSVPTNGYIYFGNAGAYFGFNGSSFVASHPGLGGGAVTTQTSYSSSGRDLGTAVQNGSKPRFVSVSASVNGGSSPATGGLDVLSGAGSPPGIVIAQEMMLAGGTYALVTVSFWVLPNHYYRVDAHTYNGGGGSNPTVAKGTWFEWE